MGTDKQLRAFVRKGCNDRALRTLLGDLRSGALSPAEGVVGTTEDATELLLPSSVELLYTLAVGAGLASTGVLVTVLLLALLVLAFLLLVPVDAR